VTETWSKLEPGANLIRLLGMKKVLVLIAVVIALGVVGSGCKHAGSREFIPGRGWVPN
jgi:hypothetical protein